jgi:hypothetical protein
MSTFALFAAVAVTLFPSKTSARLERQSELDAPPVHRDRGAAGSARRTAAVRAVAPAGGDLVMPVVPSAAIRVPWQSLAIFRECSGNLQGIFSLSSSDPAAHTLSFPM